MEYGIRYLLLAEVALWATAVSSMLNVTIILDFACAAAVMNCMALGARGGIHSVEAIES